jgi:hypothetical protein
MKLLTTLAVLAALAMPATAQVDDSMCPDMGAMAVEIMAARQAGMAISTMIELLPDDPASAELIRAVVMAAYAVPRFSTDEAQARAAADFRNDVELACYRGMGR